MSDEHLQAPSPEYLGELLPQYGIERFIAQGGMGAVYKARQLSLDRDVAIKVLLYEFGGDAEFRESFTTEAKAMARLNHPNLLGVFDYGTVDGMPYIVMEYVDGGSLHQAAWNKVIDPAQAVAIVKGICDGLAHAHEHDIVHRDIKLSNILLTPKAEPKVADFGLAHATDSDKPGLVMGTPGYTAPEVFQNPNRAGKLADIYSVGVILHQLLTGIDPAGCLEPPSQVTGSPSLDLIWRKATHITPALRYSSVAAMAGDLENWAASMRKAPAAIAKGPVVPNRPLAPRRPVKSSKGSDHGGLIVKLALCGVLAAFALFTYNKLQKTEKPLEPQAEITPVIPAEPAPIPEIKKVHTETHPEPDLTKTDDVPDWANPKLDSDPPPIEDSPPTPETNAIQDKSPGDPELLQRAIGLIADSRKKRDLAYAENIKTFLFQFTARSRSRSKEDIAFMERLNASIVNNRVPRAENATGLSQDVLRAFEQGRTKEESIEVAHKTGLTAIRDAYVTRLKEAAGKANDASLKARLIAQAEEANDLEPWVLKLAPESAVASAASFDGSVASSDGFMGKWDADLDDRLEHWIALPTGKIEIVEQKWNFTWNLLKDGTLEIGWPDKSVRTFTRSGTGWTGTSPRGHVITLTPSAG